MVHDLSDTARLTQVSHKRSLCTVGGQVQGVGFRPFIFTLAEEGALTGFVRNAPQGVLIEIQGTPEALAAFKKNLLPRLPALARITSLVWQDIPGILGEGAFTIEESTTGDSHAVLISPDTGVCSDCRADMDAPENRRYGYPFTNCTNCGPRYTITRSIPYDRASTSMGCFPLCPECLAEYQNPRNRRFHAQPNACPVCGPTVWLVSPDSLLSGEPSTATSLEAAASCERGDQALQSLACMLAEGHIAAIKGLGGFHLACNACDDVAVRLLRDRKHRPHKSFALMVPDVAQARKLAYVSNEEAALLESREHPVVLCVARPSHLSPGIAPDTTRLGIMLPYTPLHKALFAAYSREIRTRQISGEVALVMTSGNRGGEPICLGNREALRTLATMADVFLLHNRDILIRVDDSVVQHVPEYGVLILRRARGYVPRPQALLALESAALPDQGIAPEGNAPVVLGMGAELKNTLCLTKGNSAFVSQHIGDMKNSETATFQSEIQTHLANLLKITPAAIVRDAHPDYITSALAEERGREAGIPVLTLQHHYAHGHAVLAENQHAAPALVWALDGTGYGLDGTLWGGELLCIDRQSPTPHRRLARFSSLPLPGGEAAIREPWRIAQGLLLEQGLSSHEPAVLVHERLPWLPANANSAACIPQMLAKGINTPHSSSCGRLFDAVAALLGLCLHTSYEGQAALCLEQAQYRGLASHTIIGDVTPVALRQRLAAAPYPCPYTALLAAHPITSTGDEQREKRMPPHGVSTGTPEAAASFVLETAQLFAAVYADWQVGTPVAIIAKHFHDSLAAGLVSLASHIAKKEHIFTLGLSGGCLQNSTLALLLAHGLRDCGITPLIHKELPPGDGCISFGQAAWGRWQLR